MSLPPTQKDVSASPAKGSVVEPTNQQKKDRDVERKLKLYNSIQAIRASRLPSNAQVDSLLSYFQKKVDSVIKEESNLSKDTEALFTDVNGILDAIRNEIQDKNADERIQEFVWNTRVREVPEGTTTTKKDGNVQAPVDKSKAKADADEALNHIRTLINLLLTNSEARKLVSDFGLVGRDLLSRSAIKAAGLIAPDEEELARVDESTRRDQFENRDEFGEVKEQTQDAKGKARAVKDDIKAEAAAAPTTAADGATGVAPTTTEKPIGASGDEEVEEEKKKGLFSKFGSRIPEKHKQLATEHFDKGRKILSEEYFPKDRRDQWIWRAKKIVIECQGHDDYQTSIRWLLDFLEEYFGHGQTFAQQYAKSGTDTLKSQEIDRTLNDLRVLLDRFANGKSFDSLVLDKLQVMADDAKNDEELKQWWRRILQWFKNVLLEPGYILEPKCNSDGQKLFDDGKKFYGSASPSREVTPNDNTPPAPTTASVPITASPTPMSTTEATSDVRAPGKYKAHLDAVIDGIAEFVKGIGEDAGNKRLADSFAKFTKDLIFVDSEDGEGKLTFKREMWGDIRRVVLPRLVDRVGYIPIPRIEYTDDGLDLVVENLTLSGKNLFPNIVAIEAHNYVKFSPYSAISKKVDDDSRHEFIVTLSQMQADMRDVAFYFQKKSGIKLKDSGLADVVIGGDGVSVTIHLVAAKNDPKSFFEVKKVNVKIDSLKFAIRDSKHDLLYKTIKPLATGLVKKQIAKAIRDGIETGLGVLDDQLIGVRDKLEEARTARKGADSAERPSRFGSLQDAFKRTKSKDSSVSESTTGSQFKVVSNKRNSLLANKGHPAGWVNRAVVKEEIKVEGTDQGWKSDAFDIEKLATDKSTMKAMNGNTPTVTTEARRVTDTGATGATPIKAP